MFFPLGPVILERCTIGELTLSETESDNNFGRHIVGTRLEDLSQIYSGKVTINGTLRLTNVIFDRPRKVQIIVNEQKFALNVANQYWMKSIDQDVAVVRFVQPITTSQIFTDTINLTPVSNLLLITQNALSSVNFVLREATIYGHLYTDAQYKTTLATINEQSVRRTDTDVRITGRKIVTGNMTVDQFRSNFEDYNVQLAAINYDELKSTLKLKCVKHFNHITVLGSVRVTSDTLEVSSLNGIDLLAAFQNMARLHESTTLDELIIAGSVRADNLTLVSLDDTEFDVIAKRIVNGARLNTLHIGGAEAISSFSDLMVRTINGINVEDYLSKLVTTKGPAEILIGGRKRFLAGISVHGLSAGHLNGVDVPYWYKNVVHTRRPQELTGQWQIATMSTSTLYAPTINGVLFDEILDGSQDVVELYSDLFVAAGTALILNGDATAWSTLCDLGSVRDSLRSGVVTRNWRRIDINGVASWPSTDLSSPINKLLAFGVTSASNQVISGDVSFRQPIVQIMNLTGTAFIDGIDLPAIVTDALLNTNEFQAIRGEKQFVNGLAIKSLHTEHDIRVPLWNGCDILRLNGTLFRADRDQSISGAKQFLRPPLVYHLHVENGLINGIPIDDVVCANTSAILPAVALLHGMQVSTHLDILQSLNFIPFDVLLADRVRRAGRPQDVRGVLTFQNLIIHGNARLVTVNGIPIEDCVIRSSEVEQAVNGRKTIQGTLRLNGPAVVTHLNGVDLVHAYSRSLRLDAPLQMRSLQVWNNVTLPDAGMTVLGHVNNADVASLMYWQPPTTDDLRPIHGEIRSSMERVEQELQSSLASSSSVVYLDYASDIRIKFVTNGSASVGEEAVFIDTTVSCGDQQTCSCPVQNEIVAANKYQVQVTRRPLYERRIRLPGRNGNVTVLTRFAKEPCDSSASSDSSAGANGVGVTVTWRSPSGNMLSFELVRGSTTSMQIRDVALFEQDDTSIVLINYANGTVQGWRRVTDLAGDVSVWLDNGFIEHTRSLDHVCVLSWQNYNLLLALSVAQPSQVHGEGQMFYFDGSSFRPLVSGSIAGDYDQCASVYLDRDGDLMLWLGKSGSDLVTVFKTVYRSGYLRKFEVLQRIVVTDGLVHSIQSLPLIGMFSMVYWRIIVYLPLSNDPLYCFNFFLSDGKYMVILTENSFMVLYRFNHLAGWIRTTCGYFVNIEDVLPLRYGQREYLYVSMKSSAIALKLHNRD